MRWKWQKYLLDVGWMLGGEGYAVFQVHNGEKNRRISRRGSTVGKMVVGALFLPSWATQLEEGNAAKNISTRSPASRCPGARQAVVEDPYKPRPPKPLQGLPTAGFNKPSSFTDSCSFRMSRCPAGGGPVQAHRAPKTPRGSV